jgi:ribonuclease HII
MNVGIDEAGKGCIFGPVYAAAVIWDDSIDHKFLRDSKKLSKNQKLIMYDFIVDNAIDYGIGYSTNFEIDNTNIHLANMNAMHKALNNLDLEIDHIYIDGNIFHQYKNVPYTTVVSGDTYYKSIMAASILAKVSHDNHIHELLSSNTFLDVYKLDQNMGYGTAVHIEAVEKYGKSKYHRHSFKLKFERDLFI